MLARLNHKVLRLKRIALGPIPLGRLRSGKSRPIKGEELERLKRLGQRQGVGAASRAAHGDSRRESRGPARLAGPTKGQHQA